MLPVKELAFQSTRKKYCKYPSEIYEPYILVVFIGVVVRLVFVVIGVVMVYCTCLVLWW